MSVLQCQTPDTHAPPEIAIGEPRIDDAAAIWTLAKSVPELDANTSYAYLLWCRDFAQASVVAKARDARTGDMTAGDTVAGETMAGYITGFVRPNRPDTVFVWQVAVADEFRGRGIGVAMLYSLFDRLKPRGIARLEATVAPDNHASAAMFTKFAQSRNYTIQVQPLFAASDFPDQHPAEQLYIISRPNGQETTV